LKYKSLRLIQAFLLDFKKSNTYKECCSLKTNAFMEKVIKFEKEVSFGELHEVFREVFKEKYGAVAQNQSVRVRLYREGLTATGLMRINEAVKKFLLMKRFWSPFSYVIRSKEVRVISYLVIPYGSISLRTSANQRYVHYHWLPQKMKITGVQISVDWSAGCEYPASLMRFCEELFDEIKKKLDSARWLSALAGRLPGFFTRGVRFIKKLLKLTYIY